MLRSLSTPSGVELPAALPADPMPPEVRAAFTTWYTDGARSLDLTATLTRIPITTLRSWLIRYHWKAEAAEADDECAQATVSYVRALLARTLPESAETVLCAVRARTQAGTWKPSSAVPTSSALRAALAHLAMFGITPLKSSEVKLLVGPVPAPTISDDELTAYVRAGNTDALIAIAAGRDPRALPPHAAYPPEDFPRAQPGGRVVPDHPSEESEGSGQRSAAAAADGEGWSAGEAGADALAVLFNPQPD